MLSCNKDKKQHFQGTKIKDSVDYYSDKINNQTDNRKKIKLNNKLFQFVKQSQNSSQKRKYLDLIINNCFYTSDWKTYYESSNILLNESKYSKDSVYLAKSLRYKGNYFYKNKNQNLKKVSL